ncbi:MAG TPA: hypothetical protein VIS06_10990 [Mycobacteriales bacterium]
MAAPTTSAGSVTPAARIRRAAAFLALLAALAAPVAAGCGKGHGAGSGDSNRVRYSDPPGRVPRTPANQSPTPTPTSTENPTPSATVTQ